MRIRVDHIDVRVPELADAVAFFGSVGMRVIRENAARKSVKMSLPEDAVVFEIRQDPSVDKTIVHHVAFKTEDILAETAELKALGLDFTREAEFISTTGRTMSYFNDPGEGVWQLID